MKAIISVIMLLLCVQAVAGQAACGDFKDAASCDTGSAGGAACTWCKSAAVPSACYAQSDAHKLPPSVFKCDNLTSLAADPATCMDIPDQTSCDAATVNGTRCTWCKSAAVIN
jgi:hypothetical protein